jgi:hypothetical protein
MPRDKEFLAQDLAGWVRAVDMASADLDPAFLSNFAPALNKTAKHWEATVLHGLASLFPGMSFADAHDLLHGIRCRGYCVLLCGPDRPRPF